jgi:adenylate kinase
MVNIILLGPPGSGKGTQAQRLIQKYNFAPIAVGVLLRKQVEEDAPDKSLIAECINNGRLVPDDLTFKLVEQLVQAQYPTQALLFDGFPRTVSQAVFLDNLMNKYHTSIGATIFLEVPHESLLQRLKSRALIEEREDDQDISKIKVRMKIYQQETLPIVNYYQSQNKLYRVDGLQRVEQVERSIHAIMNSLLV